MSCQVKFLQSKFIKSAKVKSDRKRIEQLKKIYLRGLNLKFCLNFNKKNNPIIPYHILESDVIRAVEGAALFLQPCVYECLYIPIKNKIMGARD